MMSEETKEAVREIKDSFYSLSKNVFKLKDQFTNAINDQKSTQTIMQLTLENILREVKKTNGTVREHTAKIQELEIQHAQCPINQVEKDIARLEKVDEKLEGKSEKLEDSTLTARWAQKNPGMAKFLYVGIGVMVAGVLFGLIKSLQTLGII